MLPGMLRRADIKFARMSSGHRFLIRDLGLVKGGKGLRHHEVVLELSWRGIFRLAAARIRAAQSEQDSLREADAAEPVPYGESAFETQ